MKGFWEFMGWFLTFKVGLYAFVLLAGLVGAVADAFLNHAAKNRQMGASFFVGLFLWMLMAGMYYCIVAKEYMGWTAVVLLLANLFFALWISLTYFRETLTAWEYAGCFLAVLAIIFMGIGQATKVLEP